MTLARSPLELFNGFGGPFGGGAFGAGGAPPATALTTLVQESAGAGRGSSIVTVVQQITGASGIAQALNATPLVMAAGQSGRILIPVSWWVYDVRGGAPAMSATPTWSIRYTGTATIPLTGIALLAGATTTGQRYSLGSPTGVTAQNDLVIPVGVGLELVANVGFTGGTLNTWTVALAFGMFRP